MKIRRLELVDYKCFDHLVLDKLGDRVVLVGPNGCGKSAVLQAIAAVKEYVGSYNLDQTFYHRGVSGVGNTIAWPESDPVPVRTGQDAARIEIEIELEGKELSHGGETKLHKIGVIINKSGVVNVTGVQGGIQHLFRTFEPGSDLSVFDNISPTRTFPHSRITQLSLSSISVDQQRNERIELPGARNTGAKFAQTKMYLISEELQHVSEANLLKLSGDPHHPSGTIELLQDLFRHFFAPKELIGYMNVNNEMHVIIKTPYGNHDFDQLSSGEKELFSIIVNLARIRSLPSIVLYDEPERHLNPGLESRIIPALDRLNSRSQIWIATHGMELIGSVPMSEIIAFKREGGTDRIERFTDESKTKRVRLFESLGAKVGLQLASSRVVFMEGKESHADKRIVDKLAGPSLPGVVFVASGASKAVMGAGTRAGLIIEKAGADAAIFMVLDRDYRDEKSTLALEKKYNGRAIVWRCHEVENLLLHAPCLLAALKYSGVESLPSEQAVEVRLLTCAKGLEERFAAEMAAYRMYGKLNPDDEEKSNKPTNETNLKKMAEAALRRATSAYAPDVVSALIDEARAEIKASYSDGTWKTILPGKEILLAFQQDLIPTVQFDTFKEHIVSEMLRSKHTPSEIERLCTFINAL